MDDELRRAILEQLDLPKPIGVVPRFEGDDAADLLQACEVNGVEGVVIKRLGSLYWPGKRTSEWRKRRQVPGGRTIWSGAGPAERALRGRTTRRAMRNGPP